MASMWRQAMLYLGLGPDEEYDDLADHHSTAPFSGGASEPEVEAEDSSVTVLAGHDPSRSPSSVQAHPVSSQHASPAAPPVPTPTAEAPPAAAAPAPNSAALAGAGIEPTGSVRTIPVSPAKPHVVAPHSFNDAQQVADRFKADQPIIVNLQDVDRDLSRRIIDFTSGLCYALNGNMEKVADSVYLLAPSNVSLPEEERQRLQERGLHY
ncbi:MAG: cell division protein SepF [Actinomycetota bacterium]|jgi:cell division inhibitor SepF|nr:cell division protein SepF [Actinomycetota bacterium]